MKMPKLLILFDVRSSFALKISDEVREFAKQKGMDSEEAIEAGMKDKAKEFIDKGGEIYSS